jgi:hypothetical protein
MTQMRQCGYPLRSKLAPAAVAALLLTAGTGGSALSFAATGASATSRGNVYPPPVKSRGGALSYCPSASGLEKFDAAAEGTARTDSLRYGRMSLTVDLADSDRAWRPTVRTMWKLPTRTQPVSAITVRRVTSASHNPYRVIVRSAGETIAHGDGRPATHAGSTRMQRMCRNDVPPRPLRTRADLLRALTSKKPATVC